MGVKATSSKAKLSVRKAGSPKKTVKAAVAKPKKLVIKPALKAKTRKVEKVIEAKPLAKSVTRPVLMGKPAKNMAGLGIRELEHYRELLLAKRRELLGDVSSMEDEALRNAGSNLSNLPIHMADMGTDNYEQEFTLGLVEKDRNLLREIHQALAKIQDGTFGICEGTGKPIGKPRLEAEPWTKYSIEHARKLEQRKLR